jgi:outer membrane usher protein
MSFNKHGASFFLAFVAFHNSCAIATPIKNQAQNYNTNFLKGAPNGIDMQLLLSANSVLPGRYNVDVYINDLLVGRRDIDFRKNSTNSTTEPCFTTDQLLQFGVNLDKITRSNKPNLLSLRKCFYIKELIDQSSFNFDSSRLRLFVSVPQIWMKKGLQGYVDPTLWSEGVPGAFVNYQFYSSHYNNSESTRTTTNLGLRNGINIGGWRLRNDSNLNAGTGRANSFRSNRTYLQHDLTGIKGQFSAGDMFSDAQLFDSIRYRGIKLSSDEGMHADSERGYAPIVRGVAQSNATVEIRQNNYILYTSSVPPGPFEINDIYPSGSNGDLEIIITEADGSRYITRQAFSALPIMVREGQLRYSFSTGIYSSNTKDEGEPSLLTGNLSYGLTSNLTGIIGIQSSSGYKSFALGAGKNTLLGAFSVDITHSSSRTYRLRQEGDSVRALYAKTFTGTNTTLTLAAYRYSTKGFRTLADYIQESNLNERFRTGISKNRMDITISQSLGNQRQLGAIYVTATEQDYWDRSRSESISAGYSNSWGDLDYNLSVSRAQELDYMGFNTNNTQVSISFSLPLGKSMRAARATMTTTTQKSGSRHQAGVNGFLDGSNDTFYSVLGSDSNEGGSGSLSLNTKTSIGDLGVGYSQGSDYKSESFNASGSVVAHSGGINFGQTLGETFALVEVPDTDGVKVSNYFGVKTGSNGYAIIPSIQPYRVNWINLDTSDLSADLEIESLTQQIVPRRGSITEAKYKRSIGRRVQFKLFDADNKPIPFGALLENSKGEQLSISDPSGKALALVESDEGDVTVKWADHICKAFYTLPRSNPAVNFEVANLRCAKK